MNYMLSQFEHSSKVEIFSSLYNHSKFNIVLIDGHRNQANDCLPSFLTPAGLPSANDKNRLRNTTNTRATTDGVENVVAALLLSP